MEHVKIFHPTVFYDCVFCPGAVFYTLRDLLSHCKKNHFVCHQCDSAHIDQNSLKKHMACYHPEQPSTIRPGRKVHVKVLFVTNAACTVVQLLHLRFICLLIKRHRVHSVHRNSIDATSRNKHVSVKHSDRGKRKLNCRLALNCRQTFNNIKELGIHSRQAH